MKRPVKKHRLRNLVIQELSLVDRPANQGAYCILQKQETRTALGFFECLAAVSKRDGREGRSATPRRLSPAPKPLPMRGVFVTKSPAASTVSAPSYSAVALAKARAEGTLNDYVTRWAVPGESLGQTLVRLIARRDDEVAKLYAAYLRGAG